ncbi:DNA polymerase/3'-5' exonuclease PolX [Caenibacillus caldisaponilyticus]|uniref:DNA polymerase/3'-5' exonuclease PolX n=1 Tax=Caenibacillus caldisaponilyticus TaxID=1674942 RepID=UPI0009884656|nr:DNA polymerase/3'-5' exonuclease PolX [Caenibacillus caldisaponilyticus]
MNKKDVVQALEKIAVYLEIKGENPFKISAYRKAAQALENDDRSLAQIDDPSELKGIGKGTAQVIKELMETGESGLLKSLAEEIPESLLALLKVPGLGAKKIGKLYQQLGIVDLDGLKRACLEGRVRGLEGFGPKTEEKLLKAVENLSVRPERLPIAYMLPLAETIEIALSEIQAIERFSRAGSLRRLNETLKDLDYVIATAEPEAVAAAIKERLAVRSITGAGSTKMSIVLDDEYGVAVDFRFVSPEAYATALHHFTGSKEHNVEMRRLAKSRGEKISEYGVEREDGALLTFSSEADFFRHFGLAYIPPEIREGGEEVERAKAAEAFRLIEVGDIKADLHMHTTWSDGAYTIEEMAEAAIRKGYEYIVITDHSQSLRVAGGLTAKRLREQREAIDRLNEKYHGTLKIFAGVEMDILPDGRLDYEDDVLAELDFVIAAIHSAFSQDVQTIMKRLYRAMENPYVRLIAHPTGRIIGGRPGYPVDMDGLIEKARETGTALELNANPNRLDLAAEWLKKCGERGVKIAINTDAHSLAMLDDMPTGVAMARKGWVQPDGVLNAMSLSEFEAFLKRPKKGVIDTL